MIFNWLASRRRKKILSESFSADWEQVLVNSAWQVRLLSAVQGEKLRRLIQVFVAEKNWEGCNGLTLTDEIKVVIAAFACLLVVGFDYEEHFENVLSILVYPAGYMGKETQVVGSGLVLEGEQARIGEAWYRGPVILSWTDIRLAVARQTPGRNVVFHEFAHQLDMLNGRNVDGTPPLRSEELLTRWRTVMDAELAELSQACRQGEPTFLDCYGATNSGEFLAVTTESFFEAPRHFRRFHPELYSVLSEYYGLDLAALAEM
ncbi:M90 family metallopeptidase [Planctomicrobium piriforme]|uniref:Protein MtfA n=1 Tax=Planctomicrobium piriforme TaxID=1576369 RepID=A0A1I3C5V7_9PLAN|nr:M90 family metallopeptidase [Planctomicrobium piriforme]SFH69917.1 hypothetical protein SAMN05421753_102127 [Planctomicrobium piriforme]